MSGQRSSGRRWLEGAIAGGAVSALTLFVVVVLPASFHKAGVTAVSVTAAVLAPGFGLVFPLGVLLSHLGMASVDLLLPLFVATNAGIYGTAWAAVWSTGARRLLARVAAAALWLTGTWLTFSLFSSPFI